MRDFVGFLRQIFGARRQRERLQPLYAAVVDGARTPAFYAEAGVPDTIDGRFDMIAAMLALVLLRLERDGEEARADSVLLAELFIDDMEAEVRQIGIGDLVVGKHVGRMMGALGGRIAAFREAIAEGSGFEAPVRRNIFHDAPPSATAPAIIAARLENFWKALGDVPLASIVAGRIPVP
jgi:cytochrome b pre-mRNA-processing protein 3